MTRLRAFAAGPWPLVAAALLVALALAGPRWPLPARSWNHVVVVDVTQSMHAVDAPWGREVLPRIAFVRRALRRALAELPCGARLGVGIFTEYRTLLLLAPVEVCDHYDELLGVADRLSNRLAWAGASEVSRGLHSALRVVGGLAGRPSLVFVTDGHEAPPLRPGTRPHLDEPTEVRGTVAGIGGDEPVPIPKFDPDGQPIGVWGADEVLQTDTASLGRTVGGAKQSLVDENGRPLEVFAGSGTEHLSSLKDGYLREIATDAGLGYRRLRRTEDLADALRDPALARELVAPRDLRGPLLAAAFALLMLALWPRRRARGGAGAKTGATGHAKAGVTGGAKTGA